MTEPVGWVSIETQVLRRAVLEIGHHARVNLSIMAADDGRFFLVVAPAALDASWQMLPVLKTDMPMLPKIL